MMNNVEHRRFACMLVCLTLLACGSDMTNAQVYPSKPIRIIVGQPAGTGPDVEVRQLAAQMTTELGQPVIVENRPGDGGFLALQAVSKAAPDGYTIGSAQIGNLAANPRLFGTKPPVDVERDLVPVSQYSRNPVLLYVNAAVPATSLQEFIALAKAKPNTITFASVGVGSFPQILMEWVQQLTGSKLRHIPYGASPWMNDLLSGEVQAVMWPLVTMTDHLRSGKLRALAISNGKERSALVPNVPTFSEAGLGQFEASAWSGLVAPAGTSREVVERVARAAARAAQTPVFRESVEKHGATVVGSSPAEFDAFLKSERARWKKVIADGGIKLE